MNQYTAVVNYIEQYIRNTAPIFVLANQQKDFSGIQSQLEHALLVLKDQDNYTDEVDEIH